MDDDARCRRALIDTAEVYGGGESERIIGRLLTADPARRDGLVLATKFMPLPQKVNVKAAFRSALRPPSSGWGPSTSTSTSSTAR